MLEQKLNLSPFFFPVFQFNIIDYISSYSTYIGEIEMESKFEPLDVGYEEKVRESFNRQEIMQTVNASIRAIRPCQVELEFPYQSSLTQQHGFNHAGIVSTVLDSACGYAAFSLMPKNAAVLTIEFKVK